MPDLDDRLTEGREAVARMDPPDDLWARAVERSNDGAAPVRDLVVGQRRLRTSLLLAAAAAVVLLALVGLLWLDDDDQTVDTVPVTRPPSADQSLAEHAVLTGEEMPIGWEAAPRDAGPQPSEDSLDRMLTSCVDTEVTRLRGAGSTTRSAFSNSFDENPEQIVSEVTVFASQEEADSYLAAFRGDAVQACYLDILEQQVAEETRGGLTTSEGRDLSGDDVELGEPTLTSPVYWETLTGGSWTPVGQHRVAFHLTVPLTSEGVDITVHHDFALIKQGRAAALTTFHTYDSSATAGSSADRVRPGAPAGSAVADPAHALLTTKVIGRIAASAG
jgi:hypothetical protein